MLGRLEIVWINTPEAPPKYRLVFNPFVANGGACENRVLPGNRALRGHLAGIGIKESDQIIATLEESGRWLSEELDLDGV